MGLTGPIGAGKSTVLAAFRRHGADVLDSDVVVRDLYDRPEVRDAVVAHLGPIVARSDGSIDRVALGATVFGDEVKCLWLEALIHPLVHAAFVDWVAVDRPSPPVALVHEVQLLFEAGLEGRYDHIVVVDAPAAVRAARIAARGGLVALAERERRLMPIATKRAAADDVIDNDGPADAVDRAVGAILSRIA